MPPGPPAGKMTRCSSRSHAPISDSLRCVGGGGPPHPNYKASMPDKRAKRHAKALDPQPNPSSLTNCIPWIKGDFAGPLTGFSWVVAHDFPCGKPGLLTLRANTCVARLLV